MGKLNGRIAIVTGASRRIGIGTAICQALAKEGADILFTYWQAYDRSMEWGEDRDWPDRLVEMLQQEGVRAAGMELDLSQPEAPGQLLDHAAQTLGQPSILVNNATHSTNDGFRRLTAEILDAHYTVNIRGTCLLCAEFARRFALPEGGRIINMVSGQDKGPMPGELAYVATKGAISAFTVTLAAELAPLRITVNAVDPGPTDSGWMNDEVKRYLLPKFPMERIGQPSDAARLIQFLASDDAAWITGQIIHSDGGFRD
ncbi:3-oxoacyl-[acyl-carrier-protein] reductase FabG [Paenibacillus solanacearum]|uniref:3-oxoacyl-[acyl-carrier-protein] reductase FabG n=1 Tax=Paenibacillus solanacearum TaxID=2048548 RepID=A0A916JRZ5_9BACL|nr:SDR family oxidoreductase [Paenibacillus solanacearum]CAG7595219.1 3-oxoacyl-[acyl-carrier-protein] reductase FabG [Paenibacillus solanacearum]